MSISKRRIILTPLKVTDIISRIDFIILVDLVIDTLETTALLLGSYRSIRLLEVKKESCFSCFGERPRKSLHHLPPMLNTNSMRVAVVLVGN